MLNWLRNLLVGRPGESSVGNVIAVGSHNRVFNFVTSGGATQAFVPRIGFNPTPQAGAGEAAWLEWRSQLTPLIGRAAEQKELIEWANGPEWLSFKVIEAPGGVGKTRLAAEVAQSLVNTGQWSGGFVGVSDFERTQRLAWQGNWFVVVDYPEHSPERLAKLVRAAIEGMVEGVGAKLRVALLCRSSQDIDSLLGQQGAKGYTCKALLLAELPRADNLDLLRQSLQRLAQEVPRVSPPDFDAWQRQSPLHRTALFVIALALHLATSPAESNRFLAGAQLLRNLLDREQTRWFKAEEGQGLPRGTLTDVVACATLMNGLSAETINTNLNETYQWPTGMLSRVHRALGQVWPFDRQTQVCPVMAPDLLASVLLWQWQSPTTKRGMKADPSLIASLSKVDGDSFVALLQRWHMLAYDQTVRLQLGVPQSEAAVSNLLQNAAFLDPDFAARLRHAFPAQGGWVGLSDLAVFVSKPTDLETGQASDEKRLAERALLLNNHALDLWATGDHAGASRLIREVVGISEALVKVNPTAFEPSLATSQRNLAIVLNNSGDHVCALRCIQESVEIYRRIAQSESTVFKYDLAKGLSSFAGILSDTGYLADALKAGEEALDIIRRLDETSPTVFAADLAMILSDLVGILVSNGKIERALKVAQESIDIRRRLADINPAVYEAVLASSLNNYANVARATGDRAGALRSAKEAVEIRRRLARTNPAAFEPELATSLNNLAPLMVAAGERDGGALKVAQEAADIFSRLAKCNPAAYDSDWAMSLSNLANRLSESGNRLDALEVTKESVGIRRRLAEADPAVHEPDLAGCLNNLGNRLCDVENNVDAQKASYEAVEIYRRLVNFNQAAHEPGLAGGLNNLASRSIKIGDTAGALKYAQESVRIRRRLAEINPVAFKNDLAGSLNTLANILNAIGDCSEALKVGREAVDIRRLLAKTNPLIYEPDLAMSLKNLAILFTDSGDRPSALNTVQEAVELYEKINRQTPGVFENQFTSASQVRDGLL